MFASYNPPFRRKRFGLFPFRSPLLRVSRELRSISTNIRADGTQLILFSFPPGTEMFHFPGFASRRRYSADFQFKTERVSPFGYFRIKGYKPPPRNFSQVSRVLHSRPRPRHPPCTLMSLVRRPIYHISFSLALARKTFPCEGFFIFTYSYVKNRCPLIETKTAPRGGFRVLSAPEALRPIRS